MNLNFKTISKKRILALKMFLKPALLVLFIYLNLTLCHGQRFYPYEYSTKAGSCSPALTVEVCWNSCQEDYNCSEDQKCCETSCGGKVCSRPVTERKNVNLVKPGLCQLVPEGPWFCSSTCRSDADCKGSKKCCRNKCGAMGCYKPIPTV